MKRLCTTLAIALAAALQAPRALAVPRRWEADVSRPGAFQAAAYRGETVDFEARLADGGRPFAVPAGATARMLVSTNDFRDGCWEWPAEVTTGGVVRATWTPDMDPGAPAVRIFLGVSEGGTNVNYGANLTLRLLGSPGPSPNALEPPVRTLDFAAVRVAHAPWATPDDVAAATNGIRTVESDPVFSGWAGGEDGGTNGLLRLNQGDLELQDANAFFQHVGTVTLQANDWEHVSVLSDNARGLSIAELYQNIELDIEGVAEETLAAANNYADEAVSGLVSEDDLGTAAYADASAFASASDLADVARDASLFQQLLVGSNVVVEVTNYNSRVRSPSMRILQLTESNEYAVVWTETNGLARTLAEAGAHADGLHADALAKSAPRAWSKTTSGLGADAPSNTTWISTATTVLAGGYEYAKVATTAGEAWVLCSNGLSLGADTNGYFRLETADGEALLSVERTESVLVGVDAAGITVQGNTVTIPVPVVSQDPPVCYAARELASPTTWSDLIESSPDWIDSAACTGSSGSWVWTITTDAPSGFFQFRVLQPGATVIRNHGWTDLTGGIIVNGVRYAPSASGDTVIFTRVSGQ